MATKKNLTPTMHRAIGFANRFGGVLTRHPGGYWSYLGGEPTAWMPLPAPPKATPSPEEA